MRSSLRSCSIPLCLVALSCSGTAHDPAAANPSETTGGPPPACPSDPAQRTVKCIDEKGVAICPATTGLPGDGLRVCDADPATSMLLHYGPADYDDPDEMALFMLQPGEEDENCTYIRTPNADSVFVDSYAGRMRPHSHHLIVTMLDEAGFQEDPHPAKCALLDVVGARWLVGSQTPQIDVSVSGASKTAPPDEQSLPTDPDYRIAETIPAKTPLRMDLHYVNVGTEPLLREAWVYFTLTDQAHAKTVVDMITFFQGSLRVPAGGGLTTARARCEAKSDRYLGLLTAHGHSRMIRESMWHEKADHTSDLVYETYSWSEPGNLFYRKGPLNPAPDAATGQMGGAPGYQLIKKGEAVSFECEYRNTTDHEITLGETTKDEMCNVFGMYYPTDGAAWSCACLGTACVDKLPVGFVPPDLAQK